MVSASVVVLIGCAALGLLRAGVRETCKCDFFKEMTRWMKMRRIVSFCSREGGGAGAKYLVMRGEGAKTEAEAARRGAGRGGGGEVEHVPDHERRFGGRGLWLRLARGYAFQR